MTTSLVTGGAGFIGSHIVDHLIRMGHKVLVLDDMSGGSEANIPKNDNCYVLRGSILDEPLIERTFKDFEFDYVFHLAAYAAEGLSHFIRHYNYEVNVLGSVNLINAAVNYGVKRFVYTSSAAMYGHCFNPYTNTQDGVREFDNPRPIDPYGIAKWAVEQDLAMAHDHFGLDYTIFRPHNVYGVRQNLNDGYRNVIGIFMRQCLKGRPMTIYGDGEQTRQFTYIDDVAPYIARCVDMPNTAESTYNIGSSESHTVNDVALLVANHLGCKIAPIYVPARREARDVRVSHTLFENTFRLSTANRTSLHDGIEKMAEWAKTQTLREPRAFTEIEIAKGLPEHWRKLSVKQTDAPTQNTP